LWSSNTLKLEAWDKNRAAKHNGTTLLEAAGNWQGSSSATANRACSSPAGNAPRAALLQAMHPELLSCRQCTQSCSPAGDAPRAAKSCGLCLNIIAMPCYIALQVPLNHHSSQHHNNKTFTTWHNTR
jgi:hypothetical protein